MPRLSSAVVKSIKCLYIIVYASIKKVQCRLNLFSYSISSGSKHQMQPHDPFLIFKHLMLARFWYQRVIFFQIKCLFRLKHININQGYIILGTNNLLWYCKVHYFSKSYIFSFKEQFVSRKLFSSFADPL